jgi:hypothetical protein
MFPNERIKNPGMDFLISDMKVSGRNDAAMYCVSLTTRGVQGSVFGQLLGAYARKSKRASKGMRSSLRRSMHHLSPLLFVASIVGQTRMSR